MKIYNILKNKIFDRLWFKITCFCSMPLFIFMCILYLEYMNYRSVRRVFELWDKHPDSLILAFIVTAMISVILLLLARRLWIYATVMGASTLIIGIINCVKLAVNGDYFFPWDISMAKNMGQLISFARFDLPPYLWLFIPAFVIACVLYALSGTEIPVHWYCRVPLAAAVFAVFAVYYSEPKVTETLLNKFNMSFNDSVLQASNYTANGFVDAFAINCMAMNVSEPEGYSQQKIESYLEDYEGLIPSGPVRYNSPDVIVILSEAFFDITTLKGTTFSQEPLSNFKTIAARENAYAGNLITSALGGGTVRTEFEILTGLTVDYLVNGTSPYLYVKDNMETYVSNYKDQGYYTKAIHTYNGDFYMRNDAYPKLGFDEFVSEDELKLRDNANWRRSYLTDDTLIDEVIDTLETHQDKPNFIFGITMENHQSYGKTAPEDIVIEVKNDRLDSDVLDSVVTYTQGAYFADAALRRLVDYIDSREKDTIILFFGDHLPTLGSNQAAFNQAGNVDISDGYSFEEKMYLYSTPFLFYANYDIDYALMHITDNNISTYNMLSLLAEMTGTKMTPYMLYLRDNFEFLPYYNVRLSYPYLKNEQADFINSMKLITYDRVAGKRYSVSGQP